MNANEIQKRLALKMRLNKIDGFGITGPILLCDALYKQKFSSRLVQGYCTVNGDSCWHLWVQIGDDKYDIGYTMACLDDHEFTKCQFVLSEDEPVQYQKDQTVIDSWNLYQKDPHAYWKKAPKKIQDFRARKN
jgi:hypothetical protein